MALTHGGLFSGIGGFSLGFRRAGVPTLWEVEIDPACRAVLRRHQPDATILDDVRAVGAHNLPPVDVISFGSPCQDLSVAGRRKGLDGARSGLFFEATRIIGELHPTYAIWENVPGALSSNAGRDFGAVLDALAECGAVDICWRMLDAQYFGLAQRRLRLFLVASFRAGVSAAQVLFESEGGGGHPPARGEPGQDAPRCTEDGTGSRRSLAACLTRNYGKQINSDVTDTLIPALAACVTSREGNRQDATTETLTPSVAATLRVPSHGAAWRGDGCDNLLAFDERVITSPGNRSSVRPGDPAPTLNGAGAVTIAFSNRGIDSDTHETLRAASHGALPMVAHTYSIQNGVRLREYSQGLGITEDTPMYTLDTFGEHAVGMFPADPQMAVRRLTPTECERLQGFPDGWMEGHSDSARYRMLGNAAPVPVVEWIGRRMAGVHHAAQE